MINNVDFSKFFPNNKFLSSSNSCDKDVSLHIKNESTTSNNELCLMTYDNNKKFLKGKKIFISSGCELQHFYDYIRNICNVDFTFLEKTSMSIYDEMNNPETKIKTDNYDYYILSLTQYIKMITQSYFNEGKKNFSSNINFKNYINSRFNNFDIGIKEIRKYSKNPIFIKTFPYLADELMFGKNEYLINNNKISYLEIMKIIDLKFFEICRNNENTYLLNLESIFEKYDKTQCVRAYQMYNYGHLTLFGSVLVVEDLYNQICILEKSLKRIKCVVIDLDNTLWNGIFIEDKKVGVRQEICDILLALVSRGIIITICSKNNESSKDKILDIIGNDSYGRYIKDLFAIFKINWKPKSENIKEIAKTLNIGLDTIAFFDDSEFERNEVLANTKDVRIYTDNDIYYCLNNPAFNPINGIITVDTQKRINTYKENINRNDNLEKCKKENKSNQYELFMINSAFKLDIMTANKDHVSRIYELIQRTNQMNATLKRTELYNLNNYIMDEKYIIYVINLNDRYGDYGCIGTVILKEINKDIIEINEFIFSCRAMGKNVEDTVLLKIIKEMKLKNYRKIQIKIFETEKNKVFLKIFQKFDFILEKDNNYCHVISDKEYEKCKWF
jgi:FkbH-like protein